MSVTDKLTDALDIVTGTKDIQAIKAVIEVQKDLSLILEENRALREENHALKNIDIVRSELTKRGNGYYKESEGPYCIRCFDVDGKLVHLILDPERQKEIINGRCLNCNADGIQTCEINEKWNEERLQHFEDLKQLRKLF